MPIGQPDSPGLPTLHNKEALADRLIREAMESGEFDDLPGTGRPIPGAGTRDDDGWWVRGWIERNSDADQDVRNAS